MAVEATEATFESEVIGSEGKVIVDFWAEWCGPCHAVAPVLDRIADERDVKIVKVNIDHEQGLAQRFGVSSIPMMVLFENGEPQAQAVGALPKGALERALGLAARRSRLQRERPGRPAARGTSPRGLQRIEASRTASASRGQASLAQSPNSRSVRQASASPASGSTQRKVPPRPKWPNVARRVALPGPVRPLRVPELEAEPPVVRVVAAEARQDAAEARELHARRLGQRLAREPRRLQELARDLDEPARAAARGRARASRRSGKPQTPSKYSANGISAAAATCSASELEAAVRVDPPRAGLRERHRALERQARGVGEQVTDRRSGRAGGIGIRSSRYQPGLSSGL